jgi:mannose-6-phosphate isomerase-like protein (cupin superfamily)
MDVLSDVLQTVRLESTVFVHGEVACPWGIRAEPHPEFAFHVIAQGNCILQVDGGPEVAVGAGDVVVINRGQGHTLRTEGDAAPSAVRFMVVGSPSADRRRERDAARVRMFHFDTLPDDPLLVPMPPYIHARDLT